MYQMMQRLESLSSSLKTLDKNFYRVNKLVEKQII
jgi:hypothetical protein